MISESSLVEYRAAFDRDGYIVAPSLFSREEAAALRDHFMRLRAEGAKPGDMAAEHKIGNDPLKKFPRMIHMHRWDDATLQWMTEPRLAQCLAALFGAEPYGVQSMIYFKPAGARGQALHQDNWYLRVKPGTCMAAWMALDDCDEQNGCMQVVPGSHTWPILCTTRANPIESITGDTTPLPEGASPVPVEMAAGDVLFFNGQLVHGSFPNRTADRFRRSLIGHYVHCNTRELTRFDQPVVKMDRTLLDLVASPDGTPCGVWSRGDEGEAIVEMSGVLARAGGTE